MRNYTRLASKASFEKFIPSIDFSDASPQLSRHLLCFPTVVILVGKSEHEKRLVILSGSEGSELPTYEPTIRKPRSQPTLPLFTSLTNRSAARVGRGIRFDCASAASKTGISRKLKNPGTY